MLENKIISNPRFHFKLEYDIKTNSDNLLKVLEKIQKVIAEEFNNIDDIEAEVIPTITEVGLDVEEGK